MTKFNPQRNSAVVTELKLLNPWVDNTDYGDDIVQLARALLGDIGPISEKAHFEQRLATMGRFASGRAAWNKWSQDMLEVRGLAGTDPALGAVCDALAIANFSGTRFTEDVDFAALVFPGRADFSGSEFEADCWFQGTTFYGPGIFRQVSFLGETSFERATFYSLADFQNAMFMKAAQFREVQIVGQSLFAFADFARGAWFAGSKFDEADFSEARFGEAAAFTNCEFSGPASFKRVMFQSSCGFQGVKFLAETDLSEVDVNGSAWFGDIQFKMLPKLDQLYVAGGGDFQEVLATG